MYLNVPLTLFSYCYAKWTKQGPTYFDWTIVG